MTATRNTATLTPPLEEATFAPKVAVPAAGKEQAMPGRVSRSAPTGQPLAAQLMASSLALAALVGAAAACTPTLRIEASDKPITINLNVKIDQEIRYRLDKDLEDAIASNPDLF
jgi:hypothetical protein